MSLGRKIYLLRSQRNISQETLADELNVSRQSISKWETDQSIPELDKIQLLCQYFNISIDSLLNEDDPFDSASKVIVPKNSNNKMKRIAIIILKTCAILTVIYVVNYFLLIFGQYFIWYKYYRNIQFQFVFPYLNVIYVFFYTTIILAFCISTLRKIETNHKSVILEIVGLAVVALILPLINVVIAYFEVRKISGMDFGMISNYTRLRAIINKVLYYQGIPLILFLVGLTMSLTTRAIDHKKYVNPQVQENEVVGLGFKFLAFFMGFLGGIIIWVLSFVLYREWKYDKPIRRKSFIILFSIGLILGLFIKGIFFLIYYIK